MKILIIEDEPKLVEILKEGLANENFETDVAYDGHIGEKLAFKNFYDLLILDIIIPGINGLVFIPDALTPRSGGLTPSGKAEPRRALG